MITALIAERNSAAIRHLLRGLAATGQVQVVGVTSTGEECLDLAVELEPDALLLGSLAGSVGALELGQIVSRWDCPPLVAFVSEEPSHAAEAFEMGAVDYITVRPGAKGFEGRVALMVARLIRLRAGADGAGSAREPASPLSSLRRLPVKDYNEGTVRLLSTERLICAQRADRRVVLRTPDRDYPTYHSIESLARRLGPDGFFRASAGTLINLAHVEHLIPNGDGSYDVLLRVDGQTVQATVSRSRARELLQLLDPA